MHSIDNIKSIVLKNKFKITIIIAVFILSAVIIAGCLTKKTVTLITDGNEQKIITHKSTVNSLILSKKISLDAKDKIYPDLNSKIYNKDIIRINHAVNVNITVGNKKLSVLSPEENVESLLKTEKIVLGNLDKVEPNMKTKLKKDMNINVIRVAVKTFTQNIPLDFKIIVKRNSSMANNQKTVLQKGINGEKQVATVITYENGEEVSRKIANEKIIKKPVDKIIAQGTYPAIPLSRGGDMLLYSKIIKARATAYSGKPGKTYTSSGRMAVRNPDGCSTIAVDPNVIPIGTKLFVEGYGFAVAADTGTAIKGNSIDVFFNTKKESSSWAVKYVNVYVLN